MKTKTVVCSCAAILLAMSFMTMTVFAASNPEDDASAYSYGTGKTSAQVRRSAYGDSNEENVNTEYSYYAGSASARNRNALFESMPQGDDVSDEELEQYFMGNGLGTDSAYFNGAYDANLKTAYGYTKGHATYISQSTILEQA
ncbi:MAG: hypothetical protein ACI4WM_05360 [Erysipelotrichaceae bacterium]